jgi:hypothetical protein
MKKSPDARRQKDCGVFRSTLRRTATSSSEGGAVRLARLGHPYPGLEAFAAGVVGSGLRCEEGLVAGCSRQCQRCASEGVGRPNSGHGVRSMLLSRNCTVEPQWAMVRAKWAALRAAFESNGADRFDRVRTPPVETTHRRGGPGRATSANERGRGSAGMGKRAMREKALDAEERASRSVSMAMHEGPEGKPPAPAGTRRASACHGRIRRASC